MARRLKITISVASDTVDWTAPMRSGSTRNQTESQVSGWRRTRLTRTFPSARP